MKYKEILLGIAISSIIAYGTTNDLKGFSKVFVLSGLGYASVTHWLQNRKKTDKRVEELEELLGKKKIDERVESLEGMLQESDQVIAEQEEVIKNYEGLLDDASIKFPCGCGRNFFEGIFKPMEEVIIECDKCGAKYAMILDLKTTLISEPLEDLDTDKLIRENI